MQKRIRLTWTETCTGECLHGNWFDAEKHEYLEAYKNRLDNEFTTFIIEEETEPSDTNLIQSSNK